jgi:hypothetical protein
MFASAVLSLQMRTRVTSAESCLTGHVCISLGAHRAHGEFVHKRLSLAATGHQEVASRLMHVTFLC